MENLCKGMIFGFMAGMVVGAVVVAKNKKLAVKIKDGTEMAETKIEEAKDMIKEKFENCQMNKNDNSNPSPSSNDQSEKNYKK